MAQEHSPPDMHIEHSPGPYLMCELIRMPSMYALALFLHAEARGPWTGVALRTRASCCSCFTSTPSVNFRSAYAGCQICR